MGHHRATGRVETWGLKLESTEALTATDLVAAESNLSQMRPLILLNACNTGRAGLLLAGPGGLAERFFELGAGDVIATRWTIPDLSARLFAASVYEHLLAGVTLGESVRQARHALCDLDLNDVHRFAYTVSVQPLARRIANLQREEALVVPRPTLLPGVDAEARAQVALQAITEELVDHLVTATTLLAGLIDLLDLGTIAPRHMLETDADFRRRQAGERHAHTASIGHFLDRFPLPHLCPRQPPTRSRGAASRRPPRSHRPVPPLSLRRQRAGLGPLRDAAGPNLGHAGSWRPIG